MKKFFLFLIITIAISQFVAFAQEPATLFDSNFTGNMESADGSGIRISGWDIKKFGGYISGTGYLNLFDESEKYNLEANRKFKKVNDGKLTLEFAISLSKMMNGSTISLRDDLNCNLAFLCENNGFYLKMPNGEKKFVFQFTLPQVVYAIRTNIDLDNKKIDVFVNGELVIKEESFSENISFDNFLLATGNEAVGCFSLQYARLYKDYFVKEDFQSNGGKFPSEWITLKDSVQTQMTTELDSNNSNLTITKEFKPAFGKIAFEFQMLLPQKRDGISINVKDKENNIFCIYANNENFCFNDNSNPFYNYKANLWYHFKIVIDTNTKKAEVYLNGKLKKIYDIKAVSQISKIEINVLKNSGKVNFDQFSVYQINEIASYVPSPQKKTSNECLIGMQMCPLWKEGTHFGYDWINDTPLRTPLLGFYDEGNPEVSDWEIKWMVEHGIDFQWQCWYQQGGVNEPIQDAALNASIHDGFFNAKYSNMMDFAIMWENIATNEWTDDQAYNREKFLEYVVPFWIEYYFSDDRYCKVDNRPLLGIFSIEKFKQNFGSDEEVKALISKFKKICIENNVGEPFIIVRTGGEKLVDLSANTRTSNLGIDGFYAYALGPAWGERQMVFHNDGIKGTPKSNYQYIPTFCSGYDEFSWQRSTGISMTKDQFQSYLTQAKNEILPKIKPTLSKKIVMMGSWNEYAEGHYMMPSVKNGFSYLDAIKNVFVDTNEHQDIVPTIAQKQRIDNLYPSDRKTTVTERDSSDIIPSNSKVKKGWYFDNGAEGFFASSGISNSYAQNGSYVIEVKDVYPTIQVENINLDITDVTHIKMRIKNTSGAYEGIFNYTTNFFPNYDNLKKMNVHIQRHNNEYVDVVFPISKYVTYWKGIASGFKFNFGEGVLVGEKIYIDSIELLSQETNTYKINIDGYEKPCKVIFENNEPKISLSTLSEFYNIYYKTTIQIQKKNGDIIEDRNGVIYYNNLKTDIQNAVFKNEYVSVELFNLILENEATVDIRNRKITFKKPTDLMSLYEYPLTTFPKKNQTNVDTTKNMRVMANHNFDFSTINTQNITITNGKIIDFTKISEKEFIINFSELASGTNYVVDINGVICDNKEIRQKINFSTQFDYPCTYDMNFDTDNLSDFFHWGGNFKSISVNRGFLEIEQEKDKYPYVYMADHNFSSDARTMTMAISSKYDTICTMYFRTNLNNIDTENQKITFNVQGSDEVKYYEIPMYLCVDWKDTITKIRLDFEKTPTDNIIKIDYIRFLNDLELEQSKNTSNNDICEFAFNTQNPKILAAKLSNIRNNTTQNLNVNIMLALYNGNKLVDMKMIENTLSPKNTFLNAKDIEMYISKNVSQNAYSIRAFVWTDNAKPLTSMIHSN